MRDSPVLIVADSREPAMHGTFDSTVTDASLSFAMYPGNEGESVRSAIVRTGVVGPSRSVIHDSRDAEVTYDSISMIVPENVLADLPESLGLGIEPQWLVDREECEGGLRIRFTAEGGNVVISTARVWPMLDRFPADCRLLVLKSAGPGGDALLECLVDALQRVGAWRMSSST
jgi:hypothetical protein